MSSSDRKSPSYVSLTPASEAASKALAKVKRRDTRCERMLRSALWRRGLRFRKNVSSLPGVPDIVFPRARLAIFVDGDFWHGREWEKRQEALARGHNSDYWIKKIKSNMARDLRHSAALKEEGWSVFRVWEKDVLRDVEGAADAIVELLGPQKAKSEDRVQPT